MSQPIVDTWRKIVGNQKSWVVFKHGTCVVVADPKGDLAARAIEILKKWGPAHAGSTGGGLNVNQVTECPGWLVTGEHPDVMNYVGPEEGGNNLGLQIGLTGRMKRDKDSKQLEVVHVEDKRKAPEHR